MGIVAFIGTVINMKISSFSLSIETLSERPLMSNVKYLSEVEIIRKGLVYGRWSGVRCPSTRTYSYPVEERVLGINVC